MKFEIEIKRAGGGYTEAKILGVAMTGRTTEDAVCEVLKRLRNKLDRLDNVSQEHLSDGGKVFLADLKTLFSPAMEPAGTQ